MVTGLGLSDLTVLLFGLLLSELLHVHLHASLHRWLGDVGEWDETLGLWILTRRVLDVLFETLLLLIVDVLLVVFYTTDLLQLRLVLHTKLELVQGLAEHAVLGYLERLARVVREARLGHRVRCCGRAIVEMVIAIAARLCSSDATLARNVRLRGEAVSHWRQIRQLRVEPDAHAGGLATGTDLIRPLLHAVQLLMQGVPVHLCRVGGCSGWEKTGSVFRQK